MNDRRRRGRSGRRPTRGPSDAGASGGEHLTEYRRRRDFSRTAEPKGREPADDSAPRFVVQIHDASSLHFDFRLESDGVLKSWAVPRGPSTDPGDKRLAVPTEDHPLDYRNFEGVIAEGEYGAGTVIIWDEGRWAFEGRGSAADALAGGHLSFRLDGHKLHGGWALTRFRQNAWLLVKRDDRHANDHGTPDPARARSARTDRTLRQTAADAAHASAVGDDDEADADPS
ncbi:DNA polymerase ligase N-terminal domain-containing protein [Streptomyces triticirhizae]|uniref:DNA polymerase ligase N-terminal domain-containing protein n=1 Tax=Streptomyces triticirhizae TaxID=2483353 RepID=UPI00389A5FF7